MGISEASFVKLAADGRIGPFVKGVNQSIQNKSTFECALKSTLDKVNADKSVIEKHAITEAVEDITGGGTIKTNTEGCNEQTTNKNTCTYLSEKQCCSDKKNDVMQNMLNVGSCFSHVEDIQQSIQIESAASCGQVAGQMAEHRDDTTIKGTTIDKTTITQTPNYIAYIIAGLVALAGLAAGMMYLKQRTSFPKK